MSLDTGKKCQQPNLNMYIKGTRMVQGGGRNRIGRREKWPKQSWEEGEIGGGGGSREEGEKET